MAADEAHLIAVFGSVPLPTVTLSHPTLISRPFHRDGWVYEEKSDGWRMVAYKYTSLTLGAYGRVDTRKAEPGEGLRLLSHVLE